eukprot:NODE_574_length_6555_cov_0.194703.p3 type:complete len:249 gc:universal NODE_574_length_6555_cov_0.194703:2025-1279(-)
MFSLFILIFGTCIVNTPFCPSRKQIRRPDPNDIWNVGTTYEIAWNGQYNTFVTAGTIDVYLRSLSDPTNDPFKIFTGILASQEAVDYLVPNKTTGRYEIVIMPKDEAPLSGEDHSIPIIIKQNVADVVEPLSPRNPVLPSVPEQQPSWKLTVIIAGCVVGGALVIGLAIAAFIIHKRHNNPKKPRDMAGTDSHLSSTDMNLVASTFRDALGKPVEEEDFGVLIRSLSTHTHSLQLDKHDPSTATIVED